MSGRRTDIAGAAAALVAGRESVCQVAGGLRIAGQGAPVSGDARQRKTPPRGAVRGPHNCCTVVLPAVVSRLAYITGIVRRLIIRLGVDGTGHAAGS